MSASPELRYREDPAVARAAELGDRLAAIFARGADDPALRRLSRANTTVALHVVDAPDLSATLLLDRRPPIVVLGDEPAEVTFRLTLDQAHRMAHGRLVLALELMSGAVTCSGPVRPYLALDAILRRLLREG